MQVLPESMHILSNISLKMKKLLVKNKRCILNESLQILEQPMATDTLRAHFTLIPSIWRNRYPILYRYSHYDTSTRQSNLMLTTCGRQLTMEKHTPLKSLFWEYTSKSKFMIFSKTQWKMTKISDTLRWHWSPGDLQCRKLLFPSTSCVYHFMMM